MRAIPRASILILLMLGIEGCATLINGPTQQVLVDIPPETELLTASGEIIPILGPDTAKYLVLYRDREYPIVIRHRDKTFRTKIERTLQNAWVILDIPYIIPLIVDNRTKAWYSFDGLKIRYASDSSDPGSGSEISVEVIDDRKTGYWSHLSSYSIKLGVGWILPANNFLFFPNEFQAALGYDLSDKVTLFASLSSNAAELKLPSTSPYETLAGIYIFQIEGAYRLPHAFYAVAGFGYGNYQVDELDFKNAVQPSVSGFSEAFLVGSFAVRYMPGSIYFESRYLQSFTSIGFPNGDRGWLSNLGISVGAYFHF